MCDSKALVKDTCHVRAACAATVIFQHDNSELLQLKVEITEGVACSMKAMDWDK